jgi:hypothetical protein
MSLSSGSEESLRLERLSSSSSVFPVFPVLLHHGHEGGVFPGKLLVLFRLPEHRGVAQAALDILKMGFDRFEFFFIIGYMPMR